MNFNIALPLPTATPAPQLLRGASLAKMRSLTPRQRAELGADLRQGKILLVSPTTEQAAAVSGSKAATIHAVISQRAPKAKDPKVHMASAKANSWSLLPDITLAQRLQALGVDKVLDLMTMDLTVSS